MTWAGVGLLVVLLLGGQLLGQAGLGPFAGA
jgi:hypothetical protein